MQTEAVFAGFGGQGILFAGQILARAGMATGHNVSWLPSYGPEMRGGTANVTVIVSDEEIGAPIVQRPVVGVIFNLPSMEKYESLIKTGGTLVYNSSLIAIRPQRKDIKVIAVPANDLAQELGSERTANMIMLGALCSVTGVVGKKALESAVRDAVPDSKKEMNIEAFGLGYELVSRLET